jgi:hypothetical protein
MAIACPHCNGQYLPLGEVFANGAALLGARAPLRCPHCEGLSYVRLVGRNAALALAVLLVGVVLSYPSPISSTLVAPFSATYSGVIRADIWALAFLIAFAIFIFGSPLQKVDGRTHASPRSMGRFLGTMAFLSSLLLYGYFLFQS